MFQKLFAKTELTFYQYSFGLDGLQQWKMRFWYFDTIF